jgi:CubicO group peptidase (beta-lactamase class C family)
MSSQWLSGYCDPRFQSVADVFARALESGYEVGASLAVEYRGERIIDLFGGYCDAAQTRPWQADTLVNVFSVTKGLVATCAARLIEQQKLDVERPVADYWPEYGCRTCCVIARPCLVLGSQSPKINGAIGLCLPISSPLSNPFENRVSRKVTTP